MSILNSWITPQRAIVTFDTEAIGPNGEVGAVSKVVALPHLRALLGFRGQHAMFVAILARLHGDPRVNFDSAADKLESMLPEAFSEMLAWCAQSGIADTPSVDPQTCLWLGYSQTANRFVGWNYSQRDRATGFARQEVAGCMLAPGDASFERFSACKSQDEMIELARLQVELTKRLAPGEAAGGELLTTELTAAQIRTFKLCDLGTREA